MCGSFSPHYLAVLHQQLGVLQLNSVQMLSTQRESQTPRVQVSVLQECSHFRRQSKSRDQPAVNQRFPQHSSSWIHLLEQLTELREIFTYYIMKGYNSQMEEMYGARYVRRGIILSKIQTLSFWVFMEASLHRHDWLIHGQLMIQPSALFPSPEMRVMRLKVQCL